MTKDIDTIVTRFASAPVTDVSEGARELMHEIMAAEPEPERRRIRRLPSLRVAIPVGALLTAAVVAVTWLLPTSPAAALDIRKEGGYYVIEIKDLYANPKVYESQLQAIGLDITLRVVPSTSAFEGQVFPTSPDHQYLTEITGIYPPGPCDKMDGCAIGVKIPADFKGTADVAVGRKARPGERYESTTSLDTKGEPLHCVPFRNKTVAEVRELLKERGVSIEEYVVSDPNGDRRNFEVKTSVPDSWFVNGGSLHTPELATMFVHSSPIPQRVIDKHNKVSDCPSS